MSKKICRWGFLGAAQIARKNWKAVRLSENGVVAAIASRDVSRAESFIRECSLETPPVQPSDEDQLELAQVDALGDYQALLDRPDIDAVYVALPTGVRKQWVLQAAAAGKHVLCEKPVAVHADDAQEMIDACEAAGVQFMDGVMFDHSRRMPKLIETLSDSERFGKLRRVSTHFSFLGDDAFESANIRASADLEPHGCLGDLGWYCIRASLWASGDRLPVAVSGRSLVNLDGGQVPGEFQAEMDFGDGLSAGFFCSFLLANQQTMTLSGQFGYVTVDDFVLPMVDAEAKWQLHQHDLQIDNCRWNFGRHTDHLRVKEHSGGEPDAQEVRMIRHFADNVLSQRANPRATDLTIKTQRILDALRRSAVDNGSWIQLDS